MKLVKGVLMGQRITQAEIAARQERAVKLHDTNYNCAQCVACTCADLVGLDETTAFKVAEGLGRGMGARTETCGAISGGAIILSFGMSGGPQHRNTKEATYKLVEPLVKRFHEQNGSTICAELKGRTGGPVLRPCDDCITDAVRFTLEILGA